MLSIEDYKKLVGEEKVCIDPTVWLTISSLCELRLAGFLCLDALPEDDAIQLLLAQFIHCVLANLGKGTERVTQKTIRNFSVSLASSSDAGTFGELSKQFGDIISTYSECGVGFVVERDFTRYDDRF